MYTRRNLCFPTFHSTSTTSSPSERATRAAAARICSKFTWRLPGQGRYQVHPNRRQQKSGLAPTHRCDRFRVNLEYIPAPQQKQGTACAASSLQAALKALRPSNSTTHGIIVAHGISENPERYRSVGTSAPSSAAPHSVNGSASGRAATRQRRTQTRHRLGRLPSGILEQRCRPLWPIGGKEFSGGQRLSR